MAYPIYQSPGTGGVAAGDIGSNIPFPSTVNEFDILFIVVMDADNDYFNELEGFKKVAVHSSDNNLSYTVFWRRADGTETGTVYVNSNLFDGSVTAGIMYRYSGCKKYGDPFESLTTISVAQSNDYTYATADMGSSLGADRLCIIFHIVEDNTIDGFIGTGWTEDSRLSTSQGSDAHFAAASFEIATAGKPTNDATWQTSANEYRGGIVLYLTPEDDVPVTLNSPANLEDIGDDTTPTVEFTGDAVSNLDVEYEVVFSTLSAITSVATYYFDGSDVPAVDTGTDWVDVTNSDDGSTSTYASNNSSFSSRMVIEGTNAPGSGNEIVQVRARMYGKVSTGAADLNFEIFTNGKSECLERLISHEDPTGWNNYVTLFPPTNGWTWAILQGLEVEIYSDLNGDTRVYRVEIEVSTFPSTVYNSETPDTGFLNTANGGDTHPFNDNEKLSFTVQAGDELPYGTVYWRARALNPTGINVWDEWSEVRSFDITEGGGGATLVVQDSLHYHDVDNVALTQNNTLVSVDSVHAHSTDAIALSQAYTLVVQDTVHTHIVDGDLVLIQGYTLVVQESNHSHTADALALVQDNILAVFDTLHEHTTDAIALVQDNTVVVADSLHSHTVDNVDLAQSFTLVLQESNHAHLVDNVVLIQDNVLVVVDTVHSHSVDNVSLTQKNVLVIADSLHSHSVDNITLEVTLSFDLVVQDSLHTHLVESVVLTQKSILTTQDSLHNHSAENVILVESNVLVVNDTLHAHSSDNIDLVEQELLTVQDSLHTQLSDNILLIQSNLLDVQDSLHNHLSDNVILSISIVLVVEDSTHSHSTDNITLLQNNTLIVVDTLHNHLVDNVNLTQSNTLVSEDTFHSHTADNIIILAEDLTPTETLYFDSNITIELNINSKITSVIYFNSYEIIQLNINSIRTTIITLNSNLCIELNINSKI